MKQVTDEEIKTKKSNKTKIIVIIITLLSLAIATLAMQMAPRFQRDETEDKINLIINNKNVTAKLKNDLYMDEKGVIYLSKEDTQNYFDKYIKYYEEDKRLVTTYEDKIAILVGNQDEMKVNGETYPIKSSIISKNEVMYIPFSEMCESVYNAKYTYVSEGNWRVAIVESVDRELKEAQTTEKVNIKYKQKVLSKTIAKAEKGETLIYISESDGWVKVRNQKGRIGYVKESSITNIQTVNQAKEEVKPIEGSINLVWDYYSEYNKAPNRTGQTWEGVNVVSPSFFMIQKDTGNIIVNIGEEGQKYINWARSNGYKIWPIFSNNSFRETSSKLLENFDTRQSLIDNIVQLIQKYDLDGINLDFENLNLSDKTNYSRLIIELAPRLKAIGKTFSVDVTAPDGTENWSLFFDRNLIGHEADYVVFMAYDQHGVGTKAGTVAGYNWIENNINKFIEQEEVEAEKIILAIPLYTRLWTITDDEKTDKSDVVNVKDVNRVIAGKGEKQWDNVLKQYYIKYKEGNDTCEMWIEDETSIKEKIGLANKYKLAGVAFWNKDREPDGFWGFVKQELNN